MDNLINGISEGDHWDYWSFYNVSVKKEWFYIYTIVSIVGVAIPLSVMGFGLMGFDYGDFGNNIYYNVWSEFKTHVLTNNL